MDLLITENQLKSLLTEKYKKETLSDLKGRIKRMHNIPNEYKEFAINHIVVYDNGLIGTEVSPGSISNLELPSEFKSYLSSKGLPNGFSVGVDKNGYYVHTHRGRSKSYDSLEKIPMKSIRFVDSTG